MTTTELLKSLTENTIVTSEMAETAKAILLKKQAEQSNRNSKTKAKRAEENAPLIAKLHEILAGSLNPMTASEIGQALEVSTSKATVIAKALEGVKIGEVKVKGRAVKTYSL